MAHIVILVENLPVPLDRRVWQEALALRDLGHRITVICPRMRGYNEAEEIRDGIRILRHWIPGEGQSILGFLIEYGGALTAQLLTLLKLAVKDRPDVIHLCNPPDLLFLNALPLKLLVGSRIVFDMHDLGPEMFATKFSSRHPLYWPACWAERATLALADTVIATNETVRGTAIERGQRFPSDVFIVRTAPSNLDLEAVGNPSLKNGRSFLVGFIGVMGDADGVDLLIEAAGHLVHGAGRRDIQFRLMGTGPQFPALRQLRDQLELQDYVDLPGAVSHEELCSSLQTMDLGVGCDPINEYNHGCTMNKTLEYMAFGKAQIMFDLREGRVSAGEAAEYVSENDPKQLAIRIAALLDNPSKRAAMGEKGRKRLQTELNWARSATQLELAYTHALRPSA